jgi:hypothetical protein
MEEPRPALVNSAVICSTTCAWGPRTYWDDILQTASPSYDILQLLNTPAFATNMQAVGQDTL